VEKRKGDSLGELWIVIAILAIMAATAIPNLLRAAIADYESFAVSSISSSATPGGGSNARE
jgi:Tfp pilus assembly protein FimT